MMHAQDDIFILSSATALGIGESLILTLISIIVNLPEHELHLLRRGIANVLHIADDQLQNLSIPPGFEMLSLSDELTTHGEVVSTPCGTKLTNDSDKGIVNPTRAPPPSPVSPTTCGASASRTSVFMSDDPTRSSKPPKSRSRKSVPAADAPSQRRVGKRGTAHPIIVSSRPQIGIPDYGLHPTFINIGTPGPYSYPPIADDKPTPTAYYVITKGLYIGIFHDWSECSQWVLGVQGSVFNKVRSWNEAMSLYNSRLAKGVCEVLS